MEVGGCQWSKVVEGEGLGTSTFESVSEHVGGASAALSFFLMECHFICNLMRIGLYRVYLSKARSRSDRIESSALPLANSNLGNA